MGLNQLDSIAEGVRSKCSIEARHRFGVVLHFESGIGEGFEKLREVPDKEGRVRLPGRAKVSLHAEMKLQRAALEPGASAHGEIGGLGNFCQAEKAAKKSTRQLLTTTWYRELDVIDSVYGHDPLSPNEMKLDSHSVRRRSHVGWRVPT